ncbi:MAG: hypothetical protein EU532_05175 [Promethearchaeota archaeon]|nr:MAG: hypothetical protein EU532_05175 [Candidatus Lokiarchaeota archaeon]
MSKELLFSIYEKIKKKGKVDKDFIEFLEELIPNKSDKIIEVLNRGITKFIYKPSDRIVWTVMGREKEHIILPRLYCSCKSFYKEVVINGKKKSCKHMIAQIISEALHNYQVVELEDIEFKNRIKDLQSKF